jgi:hypothetical protein
MNSYTCFGDHKLRRCFPEPYHCLVLHYPCNRGDRYVQGTLPDDWGVKLTVAAEILLSTVYQSVRHYRQVGGKSRLLSILVHHNSFYFCCSLGEYGRHARALRVSESMLIDFFSILCDSDCDDSFSPGACFESWSLERRAMVLMRLGK